MIIGKYLIDKEKKLEILELKNGDCFFKKNDKYFFKKNYYITAKKTNLNIKDEFFGCIDFMYVVFIIISIILLYYLIINLNNMTNSFYNTTFNKICLILFLVINVIAHEFGHKWSMNLWGRKTGNINMSFKYFFPMVKVDTSDSYLLPPIRRCFVYYSGVMINIYICIFIVLFLPVYKFVIPQIVYMIIFCLIPLGGIRSDGYNIYIAVFNINIRKDEKKKK